MVSPSKVILNEENTSDEERMRIIKARRQAATRRMKHLKDTKDEAIEDENEDIFAEMNIGMSGAGSLELVPLWVEPCFGALDVDLVFKALLVDLK